MEKPNDGNSVTIKGPVSCAPLSAALTGGQKVKMAYKSARKILEGLIVVRSCCELMTGDSQYSSHGSGSL